MTTEEARKRLSSTLKGLEKLGQLKIKFRVYQSMLKWKEMLGNSLCFGLDCVLGLRVNCKRTKPCVHFSPASNNLRHRKYNKVL